MSDAPNQVTLTIDGVEVSVEAGTTLLQAAEHAGVVVAARAGRWDVVAARRHHRRFQEHG